VELLFLAATIQQHGKIALMKRLLLISPLASGLMGGGFYFRMPVFSLLKVASLVPAGWEVVIVDEKVEKLDLTQTADLVGVTAMTTTAGRAYEIARHFRARGLKVIMGGMHVSQLPEEALQHCDSVLVGEAEGLLPNVLKDFEHGRLQAVYRHQVNLPSLAGLPFPNWGLYRPKGYLPVHFVETTRGCPLDCEFCSVTNAFGGTYRNRPMEEVLRELEQLKPFEGRFILKNAVFFTDDNIVSNRAYAREFLRRIADYKLRWFGQASINIAKDKEILELCQRSGCMGIFVGLESLSTETLAAMGKRVNKPGEYLEAIQRFHDHGIGVDASFVFGFDTDDEGVFDRTVEFVVRSKIEAAYFSLLTPYPGTRLFQRLEAEGRITSRDWSHYDSSHVVYQPKPFSAERLLGGYLGALKELYSIPSIFKRLWGSRAPLNFYYPMNFGFRQSARQLARQLSP
jgi:radical SAM superfamily enzyme YgiQ (UPF0313 family)